MMILGVAVVAFFAGVMLMGIFACIALAVLHQEAIKVIDAQMLFSDVQPALSVLTIDGTPDTQ